MRDLLDVPEAAGADRARAVSVETRPSQALVENAKLAERSKHALDLLAFGSRKIAKYELLLGRIIGEIGRFAEAARRERTQLENEVKALRRELAALRQEHAATEQDLINSQLDCWTLRMRVQAMKDARTMFDGLQADKRNEREDARVIDLDGAEARRPG